MSSPGLPIMRETQERQAEGSPMKCHEVDLGTVVSNTQGEVENAAAT